MLKIDAGKLFSGLKEIPESRIDYGSEIEHWREIRAVIMMLESGHLDFSKISEDILREMLLLYEDDWNTDQNRQVKMLEKDIIHFSKILSTIKEAQAKKVAGYVFC